MTATVLCAPLAAPVEIAAALPGTVIAAADLAAAAREIQAQPEELAVHLRKDIPRRVSLDRETMGHAGCEMAE